MPRTECLADVVDRMLPYWYDAIVPDLRLGQIVLVVAHGNSLRALVKHLDGITDEAVVALNIPTGIPLHYDLDAGDPDADAAGRVPRPDRGRGSDRGRGQPGQEVADGSAVGQVASCTVRVLAGDDEDRPAGDGDGVVGVALVVAAEQGHVDRGLGAVRPVR